MKNRLPTWLQHGLSPHQVTKTCSPYKKDIAFEKTILTTTDISTHTPMKPDSQPSYSQQHTSCHTKKVPHWHAQADLAVSWPASPEPDVQIAHHRKNMLMTNIAQCLANGKNEERVLKYVIQIRAPLTAHIMRGCWAADSTNNVGKSVVHPIIVHSDLESTQRQQDHNNKHIRYLTLYIAWSLEIVQRQKGKI